MKEGSRRRLLLFATGVVLAGAVTTVAQLLLVGEGVAAAEPYAVAIGLGIAMPVLLAGAYPATQDVAKTGRVRAVLAFAESSAGVVFGVAAVALLVVSDMPAMLPVGGGAAATYLGAVGARAVVLGKLSLLDEPSAAEQQE